MGRPIQKYNVSYISLSFFPGPEGLR